MPIEVRLYKNLFWSEGNVKPNRIPTPDKKELLPRQPTMYDFANGYIKLYGEWNYAIYKGRHYFLEKAYRFDEDKKSFGYSMRLDFWIDSLYKTPILNGIIDVSNNDELLEKYLQYTTPTLIDPADATRINFKEEEHKWYKSLTIKKITKTMVQNVVTSGSWEWFLRRHRHEWAQQYKNNWCPNYFNTVNGVDAIYIFGYLKPTAIVSGWKNKLARKINKLLDSLGEDYKIAKVNSPENSVLVGKYCITSVREGIGGGPENVDIESIDLSNLRDIKEIRITDLDYVSVAEEDFNERTAVFNIPDINPPGDFGYKVCRKFYGSFRGKNSRGKLRATGLGAWILDEKQYLYHDSPITDYWFDIGNIFARNWIHWEYQAKFTWGLDTYQLLKFRTEAAGVEEHVEHGITYWVDRVNFLLDFSLKLMDNNYEFRGEPQTLPFPIPAFTSYVYDDYEFSRMKNFPGFGFLIYQTLRHYKDWDTIQYIGKNPLISLDVITGLNESFNTEYGNEKLDRVPRIVDETTNLKGNMGVLLFYLDFYLFLAMVPSCKDYSYGWVAKDWIDAFKLEEVNNNKHYVPYYIQKDFTLDGQKIRNPYSEERYLHEYAQKRFEKLEGVTIREALELPWSIKEGDFFFSDMEYAISDIKLRNPHSITGKNRILPNQAHKDINVTEYQHKQGIAVLSDFIRTKEENSKHYFDILDKSVILCSNKNKELEVRTFRYFKKNHTLDRSRRQVLYTVDDQQEKEIRYVHISNLGIKIDHKQSTIPDNVKLAILKAFYEFFDYKFNKGKWSWISDEQLEKSKYDRLFDLEGTDWYCHLKKGKVSLIAKNERIFKKIEQKVSKVDTVDKLKKLSLLEKINQRCYLTVHTNIRPLKTKFNFSEDNFFNVTLFSPKPTPYKDVGSNHYILQVKDKFDIVDREFLSIPKTPTDSVDIADATRIEQLKLIQLRAEQDYAIGTGELDLKETRIEEHFYRDKWNAGMRIAKAGLGLIRPGLTTVLNIGTEAAGKSWPGTPEGSAQAQRYVDRRNRQMKRQFSRAAIAAPFIALTEGLDAFESFRRAGFDRETAIKQLNFERNQLDLRHERVKQDSFLLINSLSNVHRRGIINDALLMREVNDTEELNDGQKMKDVHLTVYTPSEEQLKYLVDHKERHGVDCYIPNQKYEFFPGMSPDVIRFKDLYSEDVKELDDLETRKAFLSMIYGGVKIVDVKEETHVEDLTEAEKLTAELTIEKEQNQYLETQNKNLTSEVETVKEAIQEEKNKNEWLTTQVTQLTENVNQLNTSLTASNKRADTLSASVHKLEGELTQQKNLTTLLQAEVNKFRPKAQEYDRLQKYVIPDLKQQISVKDTQLQQSQKQQKKEEDEVIISTIVRRIRSGGAKQAHLIFTNILSNNICCQNSSLKRAISESQSKGLTIYNEVFGLWKEILKGTKIDRVYRITTTCDMRLDSLCSARIMSGPKYFDDYLDDSDYLTVMNRIDQILVKIAGDKLTEIGNKTLSTYAKQQNYEDILQHFKLTVNAYTSFCNESGWRPVVKRTDI